MVGLQQPVLVSKVFLYFQVKRQVVKDADHLAVSEVQQQVQKPLLGLLGQRVKVLRVTFICEHVHVLQIHISI
jgi:septum formation inhibitor-activating ATPase MinD